MLKYNYLDEEVYCNSYACGYLTHPAFSANVFSKWPPIMTSDTLSKLTINIVYWNPRDSLVLIEFNTNWVIMCPDVRYRYRVVTFMQFQLILAGRNVSLLILPRWYLLFVPWSGSSFPRWALLWPSCWQT